MKNHFIIQLKHNLFFVSCFICFCRKNKAWEKDRRDRLNKSFDELAKLLPKFDKSIVWSKIEIIQKAIAFIADLHKRLEDYLTAKDPELLSEFLV